MEAAMTTFQWNGGAPAASGCMSKGQPTAQPGASINTARFWVQLCTSCGPTPCRPIMKATRWCHHRPLRLTPTAQPISSQPGSMHRVGNNGGGLLPAPVGTGAPPVEEPLLLVLRACLVADTSATRLSPSRLQLSLGPVGTGAPVGTDRLRLSLEWLRRTGCRAMKRRPMRSGLAPCLALAQQRLSLQRLSLQRLSLQASSALMQKQ